MNTSMACLTGIHRNKPISLPHQPLSLRGMRAIGSIVHMKESVGGLDIHVEMIAFLIVEDERVLLTIGMNVRTGPILGTHLRGVGLVAAMNAQNLSGRNHNVPSAFPIGDRFGIGMAFMIERGVLQDDVLRGDIRGALILYVGELSQECFQQGFAV
jgi:hypothetical protein